jgi:serine/threonine-protein kinase
MAEASLTTIGDVGAGHTLGRYELLIPIAKGGMAVVFAARMRGTRGFQKLVAVKTIRTEMTEDPQFEQMFLDEASLASRIRHPHVVEILDLGEDKGVLYLVMEWIDGEPLHVILKEAAKKGGVPLSVAVRVTMQLAAGLHAAHELRDDMGNLYGVVHRDISPQNVLITGAGVAKLVDFGVAKAQGRAGGDTVAGQIKGKVPYMAPEQASGGVVDRRSDIFSLGIVLYMMTTGKHPFRRDNDAATIMNICSDARAYRPSKLVPGFPPKLDLTIMQALEKDPSKRFPTANDLLRALDQALPSSMRASTDEEVSSFVQTLVGNRLEKRRDIIREALDLADERKLPSIRPQQHSVTESTNSGLLPLSAVTATDVIANLKEPKEPSDPRSERWSFEGPISENTGPSLSQAVDSAQLLLPPSLPQAPRRKGISPSTWIAVAALLVAAISVIVVVITLQRREPAASGATAVAALPPPPPVVTGPAATPPATASDPSIAEPEYPDVEADSSPPDASATAAPTKTATGTRPVTTPTKTAPTKTAPTSTALPQIHDPGF